ncbi:hypothetical protein BRD00_08775 [Halobacteriales archaeon QS_8_69_26]|nr:MAG: hypothetical protein BRD00_08775 [Halobacteriales archaeon QS_8_69_26]
MANRVLLVDPDEGLLEATAAALESEGGPVPIRVTTVTDPQEALERIDGVDCAVSGHRPPGLDGIEFLERVRERRPDLPVVLYPEDGSEVLAGEAVAAGVTEYVPRDGDGIRELVRRVERAARVGSVATLAKSGGTREAAGTGGDSGGPAEGTEQSGDDSGVGGVETSERGGEVPAGVHVPDEVQFELKERAMDEAPVGITISDPSLPDNPLIYVNDAFERTTGYSREEVLGTNCRFLQGEETARGPIREMAEAIDAEEPVSVELVNYRKDGEKFWNKVDIAPLRNEAGEVTHYVGFQTDVTARKRAEFAVERYAAQLDEERAALERILDRVNGLVRDVTETLVGATTRREIDQRICDQIARTPPFVGAWVGELDLAGDAVTPVTDAGLDLPGDEPTIRVDGDGPIARAVATGELQPVDGDIEWGDVGGDPEPAAVVPLVYRDTSYGVLVVYAEEAEAVDERERAVLAALGRMIATAINATETKAIITAENVVSVEFETRDPDLFFVGLSDDVGARFEHVGSVSRPDEELLVFFAVEGADPEAVLAAAESHDDIERATLISESDDETLFEFATTARSILAELADYGAETREMSAQDGVGRLGVEAPHESVARSVVDLVTDRYDAELVTYRERERPPATKGEFITELRDRLTERQLTALQKAYVSGYYDWPRTTSGDELAESMGVSRSTFHQHLRAAERKLVGAVLDGLSESRP